MPPQNAAILLEIFHTHLLDKSLSIKSLYKEHPQWTSLKALVIVNEIEQKFKVLLSPEDLKMCDDIEGIIKRITK